jgi:hypothetical protein
MEELSRRSNSPGFHDKSGVWACSVGADQDFWKS